MKIKTSELTGAALGWALGFALTGSELIGALSELAGCATKEEHESRAVQMVKNKLGDEVDVPGDLA